MNSAIIMEPDGYDVTNSISQKAAKVSTPKCENIRLNGRKFHVKNAETANEIKKVGVRSSMLADKFKLKFLSNVVGEANNSRSARKVKTPGNIPENAKKTYDDAIISGIDVKNESIINNVNVVQESAREEVSNIIPFNASKVLATPEYNRSENVNKEPVSNVNNMYSFATGKPIVEPRSEVNTQVTTSVDTVNNNLSRTARMDYNVSAMTKEEPKEIKQTAVHPEFSSISEYVQQKNAATTNNSTNNTVDFIAEIAKRKKKIESLANKTNQVKGDTAERLKKFNEILSYYDNMVSDAEKKYSEAEQENIEVTQAYDNLVSQVEDYAATRGIAM